MGGCGPDSTSSRSPPVSLQSMQMAPPGVVSIASPPGSTLNPLSSLSGWISFSLLIHCLLLRLSGQGLHPSTKPGSRGLGATTVGGAHPQMLGIQ